MRHMERDIPRIRPNDYFHGERGIQRVFMNDRASEGY